MPFSATDISKPQEAWSRIEGCLRESADHRHHLTLAEARATARSAGQERGDALPDASLSI